MLGIGGISFNSNIKNTNNIAFKGHNLSVNDKGEKVYKFFIPKISFNNAKVIIKKFPMNEYHDVDIDNGYDEKSIAINNGSTCVEVNPKEIDLAQDEYLGYKFVIDGKEYFDTARSRQTPTGRFNIASLLSSDVMQTPKSIYHLIPATFNPQLRTTTYTNALGETVINDDKTARINHFMKYDTSIQNIIEKIPHVKEMGFRRILSTPLFGQDNLSSHGYWTTNPFQITQRYGSIKDFEDLQINLFKNSMGFIADGAFTNEGLMGIHLRDIIRNGNNSPFKHWFELYNFPAKPLKFGVLPDSQKAYDNFDIRVVNSPVMWSVNSDGTPSRDFGKTNPNYDSTKETYIQLYDKRLTSSEQLEKDEVFNAYAIRNTKNPDDITDWMDSVQPYAFPVKADIVKKKAKEAVKNSDILPKEHLMQWENFELATAKSSSGINLWVGNKDIGKLRFTFPHNKKLQILDNSETQFDAQEEVKRIEQATSDVRNYIKSVGRFWTNKTSKFLRSYIINILGTASSPFEFKNIIVSKAGKDLPASVKYITEQQISNALSGTYESINSLEVPQNIEEALNEYPFEAVEVSDDLTSILAYPQFKTRADKDLMPKMVEVTKNILGKLDNMNLSYGKFLENDKINPKQLKTLQLISDEIKRFLIIKGFEATTANSDIFNLNKENLENLKNISAKKLCLTSNNPNENIDNLVRVMKKNIGKISDNDISEFIIYLSKKLDKVTPDNIKIADLIIDKTESGLNWRIDAAKDIADIEGFLENEISMKECWGQIFDFWKSFNDSVKLYNKHSYKIGEFTDTGASYSETNDEMFNAGVIEDKLVEQGGFTTQSNFNYMFDLPQRIYSGMPENEDGNGINLKDIFFKKFFFDGKWNGVPGLLYSGNKNNIVFSHVAVGNHDKPRIGHGFTMDVGAAYANGADKNAVKKKAYYDSFAEALYADNNIQDKEKIQADFCRAMDEVAQKSNFFYKNFESTYFDILAKLKTNNSIYYETIKSLEPQTHKALTKPAIIRGKQLARLLVALPGSPTLFAGDELLETGSEEKAKNYAVQNRNRPHWEKLQDTKYEHVKDFKNALAKIYDLRNDEGLTSLVNGDTILLNEQGKDKDVVALYRYNDKDDCIILMHNKGFNNSRYVTPDSATLKKIDMQQGNFYYDGHNEVTGLPSGHKFEPLRYVDENNVKHAEIQFVDALNPDKKFIVTDEGDIMNAELDEFGHCKDIELTNSVTILKRVHN